jgi:hypothetical protein
MKATGVITGFSLTPANGSEREALWEMVQKMHGLLLLILETAVRFNMQDSCDPVWVALL